MPVASGIKEFRTAWKNTTFFSVNPFAQGLEAGIGPMGAGSGMGQAGSGGHPGMR